MTVLQIQMLKKGAILEIKGAEHLALDFFREDPSSKGGGSYDAWAVNQKNPKDCFIKEDVHKINQSMGARSAHKYWERLLNKNLGWLVAIDHTWDLVEMSDADWQRNGCLSAITKAIEGTLAPGRNISVATKALHLKRPNLIPICDSLVQDMLGMKVSKASEAATLINHVRNQARANLRQLQELQVLLRSQKPRLERSLVRIFDGLVWSSHPTSGISLRDDASIILRTAPPHS